LFSTKLKKAPKVNKKALAAVTKTEIWSVGALKGYVDEVILKQPEISLLWEPILLIIDSYRLTKS
jgi:hypothetical protein